ncbi:MAG: alpha/beta fold hydrolase [Planctomycetes bacterium]|nr:alpha/beta fold hydrolase [Planctomycetota bacterium]NOG53949.1 alpha/beta fold hydrolase [Planctomycetota bacterium]
MEQALGLLAYIGLGAVLVIVLLVIMLAWGLTHPPRLSAGVAAARGWWIDPSDADLKYDEWWLERPGGTRLPVWEMENPARPQGPIVFVTHCWGGSRIESLQRAPFLFPFCSRLILWDLRGHGDAGRSISTLGAIEVDDLLDLVDKVCREHSLPVILYGFSMGAGISICAATKDDRVVGVVADGPYRWTAEPVRSVLEYNAIPHWPALPLVQRIMCLILPGLRGADRAKYAAQLQCPLLVLHGTEDPFCSINSAMEIAEAAPEADFVVMPHAAHLDLHVTSPDRYQSTIQGFMRKCTNRVLRPSDRQARASGKTAPESDGGQTQPSM